MASTSSVISVTCDCGKRLKAPAAAAGKRARCPACGNEHVLPAPASAPPADPFDESGPSNAAPQHDDHDPFGALDELANQENAPAAQSGAVHCPQCRSDMTGGAVLCVNCGYDTRTGQSAAAAVAVAPAPAPAAFARPGLPSFGKKTGKNVDHMAPTGSLVLGVVFSAVFALIASILWIVVAWLTGFTVAYIAILIGIAAGIGMQVGHKGQSQAGGLIAGAMTLLAILIAKVIVVYIVMAKLGVTRSIWDLDSAALGMYFFNPIGLIIIAVGVGAGYRTASGAIRE
jgi:hypothetical protein